MNEVYFTKIWVFTSLPPKRHKKPHLWKVSFLPPFEWLMYEDFQLSYYNAETLMGRDQLRKSFPSQFIEENGAVDWLQRGLPPPLFIWQFPSI